MKNIKLLVVLFVGLQLRMCAAQESKQDYQQKRQAIINEIIQSNLGLQDGFNFLQSQNLVNQSFYDFLEQNLHESNDEDKEIYKEELVAQAEEVLTQSMKDPFILTLEVAMKETKHLYQFYDSVSVYVLEHKDGYMQPIVRQWLYKWSKDISPLNCCLPLHHSIKYNNVMIASMLIDAGADVTIQDNEGLTPLHWAAYWNSSKVAGMLIAKGANLNIQNNDGTSSYWANDGKTPLNRTPLHWAAYWNSSEVAGVLINAGANLNLQDNRGSTPLHLAAYNENAEVAYLLIVAGANLNLQDNSGTIAKQLAFGARIGAVFMQAKKSDNNQSDVSCTIS